MIPYMYMLNDDNNYKKGDKKMLETKKIIKKINKHGQLFYLYDRWQEEKEYEDFADYIENAKKFIEKNGLVFVKMTKGFKVIVKHNDTLVKMKITNSYTDVSYQKVIK